MFDSIHPVAGGAIAGAIGGFTVFGVQLYINALPKGNIVSSAGTQFISIEPKIKKIIDEPLDDKIDITSLKARLQKIRKAAPKMIARFTITSAVLGLVLHLTVVVIDIFRKRRERNAREWG